MPSADINITNNECIWGGFPTEYSFDVHRGHAYITVFISANGY
jgi:hypothetical protein